MRKKKLALYSLTCLLHGGLFPLTMPAGQAAGLDVQSASAAKQMQATKDAMTTSLDKQKQSLRRQLAAASQPGAARDSDLRSDFFLTDALIQPLQMSADCEQLSPMEVESLSQRAAKANDLSADLVRAVMGQESDFRPCAVSPVGALGLMQLMPGTAGELDVLDPLDAEQNVFGGARLLRKLMDRYGGNLNRTLGAYNAGPARVDEADGVPDFPETLSYVSRIMTALTTKK